MLIGYLRKSSLQWLDYPKIAQNRLKYHPKILYFTISEQDYIIYDCFGFKGNTAAIQ